MNFTALLTALFTALAEYYKYKSAREKFDLANIISDKQISVNEQVSAYRAAGNDAAADLLRDNYSAIAGAAGQCLIQPAGTLPSWGSTNTNK